MFFCLTDSFLFLKNWFTPNFLNWIYSGQPITALSDNPKSIVQRIESLCEKLYFKFIHFVSLKIYYRIYLLKNPSIMFSHEPCFGVNTNSNLHSGFVPRKALVSFDLCAEWLSSMIRIGSCAGYFKSSIFRKRTKSELLWVWLTSGMASTVSRPMAASRETVPGLLYS